MLGKTQDSNGREIDSVAGTEMLLSGAVMLKAIAEGSVQGAEAILAVSVELHHALASSWVFAAKPVASPVKAAQRCALCGALPAAGPPLYSGA